MRRIGVLAVGDTFGPWGGEVEVGRTLVGRWRWGQV